MRNLQPITVGKYQLSITTEHVGGHVVAVTVGYGDEYHLTGRMADQGAHDRTEEQFAADVQEFAQRLATELAGRIRSVELAKKFTATE